ncbi:MAG: hypothetical protein NC417_11360 [Candidatus Gastranaerophilales bacterium]|nr:hypothetical protein [Candidatus Gastranaerophilales bacterium]
MLGKLIKYEWKSVYKVCTILLVVVLGMSLVGILFFNTPFWSQLFSWEGFYRGDSDDLGSVLTLLIGMFTLMLYVCVLIGGMYGLYIYLLVHFYRSMYTDEGYLTHTLPVNSHHLLISKILVGGLWLLIMEFVIMVSVVMVSYSFVSGIIGFDGSISTYDVFRAFGSLLSENLDSVVLVISFILMVLTVLVSPFATMSMYFCGISLGQLSRSYKGLMGILGCFGVIAVNMFLSFFVQLVASWSYGYMVRASNLGALLISLGMGVGCYFFTHYLMTARLNLD